MLRECDDTCVPHYHISCIISSNSRLIQTIKWHRLIENLFLNRFHVHSNCTVVDEINICTNWWNRPKSQKYLACNGFKIISVDVFLLIRLRHIPRPKMSVCVLGDQQHCDEAKANNVPCMDQDALKKLNKQKKPIKKLGKCRLLDWNLLLAFCIYSFLYPYFGKWLYIKNYIYRKLSL